jgi:S1-C subfamily serine protease
MSPRIAIALACLAVSGCVAPTARERNESFAPFRSRKIGDWDVHSFLVLRYAILRDENGSIGSAAAIDHRGYLITAAHCVSGKSPRLWMLDWKEGTTTVKLEAKSTRVVWRGDTSKGEPDLAVLRISEPLARVFTWASAYKAGDIVAAIGPNYDIPKESEPLALQIESFAGRIVRSKASTHQSILLEAPAHPGDSGGPVILPDGSLLGITSEGGWLLTFRLLRHRALVVRPDLPWLQSIIDKDFASEVTNQVANKAPEPTTGDVTPRAPSSTSRAGHGRGSP